jgi:hypothetical protein
MEFLGKTKENHKRFSSHSPSVSQDSDLGSQNVVVKCGLPSQDPRVTSTVCDNLHIERPQPQIQTNLTLPELH